MIRFVLFALVIVSACSKPEPIDTSLTRVDFYLIKSFTELPESDRIDPTSIELEDDALVAYEDIIWYNSTTHSFKIKDDIQDLFKLEGNTVHYKAFAIKTNSEIVYTGFFWPSYSSQSIKWTVIDPIAAEVLGEMKVCMSYPGMLVDESIPDMRNSEKIVKIFKNDNKLIE